MREEQIRRKRHALQLARVYLTLSDQKAELQSLLLELVDERVEDVMHQAQHMLIGASSNAGVQYLANYTHEALCWHYEQAGIPSTPPGLEEYTTLLHNYSSPAHKNLRRHMCTAAAIELDLCGLLKEELLRWQRR